jgi:hypothetical protein
MASRSSAIEIKNKFYFNPFLLSEREREREKFETFYDVT